MTERRTSRVVAADVDRALAPPPGEDPLIFDGKLWHGYGLRLAHAFGLHDGPIRDAVISIGDDAFLFFVGRHIAICDYVQQKVTFLQHDARNRTVTAATKSGNGKMLAVSERLGGGSEEGQLQISILSLPRDGRSEPSKSEPLKVLHPTNRRMNIIGLAFTTDAKYLVSLSGEPDATVTFWRWEIEKVMATHDIKLPVTRLSVNPRNGYQLVVTGPQYIRFWEYNPNDQHLREFPSTLPIKDEKFMNIVDHCWVLSMFLAAATEDGHVHLFEDGEHRHDLDIRQQISKDEAQVRAAEREQAKLLQSIVGSAVGEHKEDEEPPPPVRLQALASWSCGFVVGGDQGYLGVFRVDTRLGIEPFGTFRMPGEAGTIYHMSAGSEDSYLTILSFSEQEKEDSDYKALSASTRTGRRRSSHNIQPVTSSFYSRARSSVSSTSDKDAEEGERRQKLWTLSTFPVGQADLAATGQLEVFAPVFPLGTHHGPVLSMGAAALRRVVVTSGTDMQLRVWGYPSEDHEDDSGGFFSELCIKVSSYEKPKSIAVHPLGFQVAVILNDLLRVYHLTTANATRTLFDLPLKHPGDCTYSNTGHLLAVTSGNDVILLDPWRNSLICMFSSNGGHLSRVNQVLFSDDDRMLLSCSAAPHGSIYGWNLQSETKERAFEHVSKGTNYGCFAHDFQRKLVVACTRPEGHLRVIGHLSNPFFEVQCDGKGMGYTTLCLSAPLGVLFAGTQQGSVCAFRWPMTEGGPSANPFAEYPLHAHGIAALSLSYDLRLLFSACDGGVVMSSYIDSYKQGELADYSAAQRLQMCVNYRHYEGNEDVKKKKKTNRDDELKIQDFRKKLAGGIGHTQSPSLATLDAILAVPKNFFNDRLSEIKDLEERMQNLRTEQEIALEQRDIEVEEKMNAMSAERKNVQKQSEEKIDQLFADLTTTQSKHEDEMGRTTALFDKRTREMQETFEDRLSKEYEKQSRLLAELQNLKEQHITERAQVDEQHQQQLAEMRKTQEKAMREWRAEYEKVCNLLKSDGLKFEEALRQQESEYESQISEILETKRTALQVESEKSTTALKDGVSMKQTISMLQRQLKTKDEALSEAMRERDELKKRLDSSQDMFAKVKEQLKERERGLKVKDESLNRLREQMKHLESFRFVLFHKVRALEEERDPLEEQVRSLKSSVREMYNEFVHEFRQKQHLDQQLGDKSSLAGSLQKENVRLRSNLTQLKKDARRLLLEVEKVLHPESADVFEKMPKMLSEVLERHQKLAQWTAPDGADEKAAAEQEDSQILNDYEAKQAALVEEMVIQRDLLFRKNQIAESSKAQARRECAFDIRKLVSENAQLIAEVNELQAEKKSIQRSAKEMEAKLLVHLGHEKATQRAQQGLHRVVSAPEVKAETGSVPAASKRQKVPAEANGATPYVRRKILDQQEVYRRQRTKGNHSLPPMDRSGAGPQAPIRTTMKPSAHEKRFEQSLGDLEAGRRHMERQGFDMSRLHGAAQASAAAATAGTGDLPLSIAVEPPSASSPGGVDGGEDVTAGSFANAQAIQQ
mmetsp:Transcript_59785/g.142302  ORF Transcript_59785/g.142302 Transcript_59785/m.142302 type:complete len:1538 (+) Transcript_59785:84-4697(+)